MIIKTQNKKCESRQEYQYKFFHIAKQQKKCINISQKQNVPRQLSKGQSITKSNGSQIKQFDNTLNFQNRLNKIKKKYQSQSQANQENLKDNVYESNKNQSMKQNYQFFFKAPLNEIKLEHNSQFSREKAFPKDQINKESSNKYKFFKVNPSTNCTQNQQNMKLRNSIINQRRQSANTILQNPTNPHKNESISINQYQIKRNNSISSIKSNQDRQISRPNIKQKNNDIDHINTKIRQILKCLKQNPMPNDLNTSSSLNNSFESRYIRNHSLAKSNIKTTQKQQVYVTPFIQKYNKFTINQNKRERPFQNKRSGVIKRLKVESINKQESIQKQEDLDDQIKKIQQKIKKSQEEKRKLNQRLQSMKKYNFKQKKEENVIQITNSGILPYNNDRNNSLSSNLVSPKFKQFNSKNGTKQIQSQKLDLQNVRYVNSVYQFSKAISNDVSHQKSLPTVVFQCKGEKIETKKLLDNLSHQISLDIQLNNAKIIFNMTDSNQKWKQLKQQLSKYKIYLDEQQLKKEFGIQSVEHSFRNQNKNIISIARCYAEALHFWTKNIKNRFDIQVLLSENFNSYIQDTRLNSIEDFTKFINKLIDRCLQAKDVLNLYRRFTKDQHLSFNKFLEVVTFNM